MLVSARSRGSPLRITSVEKDEPVADVRDFCYLLGTRAVVPKTIGVPGHRRPGGEASW